MFGRTPRTKLPEQLIAEIDAVYSADFRGPVFIVDDNFIGNKSMVNDLLKHLKIWQEERGFPFTFFTEASINLAADDELMNLMVSSNFDMVFVGIETPDPHTHTMSQKNQNASVDLRDSTDVGLNSRAVKNNYISSVIIFVFNVSKHISTNSNSNHSLNISNVMFLGR